MSIWGWVAFVAYCLFCLIVGGFCFAIIDLIEHPDD